MDRSNDVSFPISLGLELCFEKKDDLWYPPDNILEDYHARVAYEREVAGKV